MAIVWRPSKTDTGRAAASHTSRASAAAAAAAAATTTTRTGKQTFRMQIKNHANKLDIATATTRRW